MDRGELVGLLILAAGAAIFVFAFIYALMWLMEAAKTCWWNLEACPFKPWIEGMLNGNFSKVGGRGDHRDLSRI